MSTTRVLLLTPPFTQLNTPYPGTMYLKGFLNTVAIESFQADLGIEVILELFSKKTLEKIFRKVDDSNQEISENAYRILSLKDEYIRTIDPVIKFLQNKNSTLAYGIAEKNFLPKASRFSQLEDLEWAFGTLGIQDKARHLATLYLEDLSDFIKECVDEHFGFSRYAERLATSATTFDLLNQALNEKPSFTDQLLLTLVEKKIKACNPTLVCLSIPFPGNLYAGLRIGQYIKENYPHIKIEMGGGYPNTELRSLKETRVFNYVDFIALDDGERPLLCLIEHLEGKRELKDLKRTFALKEDRVVYCNQAVENDIPFAKTGTPSYANIDTSVYLSVLEVANPMHRLWSDGRWNKLTMAHGCYWKKCSFCDISLDYIGSYEPVTAAIICDRIEEQVEETGETGFHFVDEAAPPALMKELALEILRRKLTITWWTNIRFESSFTADLCKLLALSGCIAVSGGLEVASDRLLALMEKGVTVEQVAKVSANFTDAGIMVHAYLMYGFPTQTEQETIDSLEMVRQLFMLGIVQSGFWHQFAMTAHSPVGVNPDKFKVIRTGPEEGSFANNDLSHEDPEGADHELFSDGLKRSLFNYMHHVCFDYELQEWFEFDVPTTTVSSDFIENAISKEEEELLKESKKVVWTKKLPESQNFKDESGEVFTVINFEGETETIQLETEPLIAEWIMDFLEKAQVNRKKFSSLKEAKECFESDTGLESELLDELPEWQALTGNGLLRV